MREDLQRLAPANRMPAQHALALDLEDYVSGVGLKVGRFVEHVKLSSRVRAQ